MDFFKKASASFGGSGEESDLLKQAQGFLGSSKESAPAASTGQPAASGVAPVAAPPADAEGKEGYTQLYGSAQTLYQGLQDKFSGKQSNVDDQQLAGAAENVLKAAEDSGIAKDGQYGDYFNKAESYLQNYAQPRGVAATPTSGAPPAAAPPVAARPAAADAPPADAPAAQ